MDLRYFQYIAGERAGEVLIFDKIEQDDDLNFVAFKDGSRCNEELILPLNNTAWEGKLMAEVSDPNNIWKFKTEWVGREEEVWETNKDGEKVCVQPFVEGRKKVTAIPPKKTESKFGQITEIAPVQTPIKQTINTQDPVFIMLDKAKKYDIVVPMELTIALPSKSLYNVAKESFEDGSSKVIEYIINNLDDTKLKNSLKIALLSAYEEIEISNNTLFEPQLVDQPIIGEPTIQEK